MDIPIGKLEIEVPVSAIDTNGHVNNVQYVQWMQDAAMAHSRQLGWPQSRYLAMGKNWIIRSHNIEYHHSTYAGELIYVYTWVATFERIKSLRKFRFYRPADKTVLARAATMYILCDILTGKPTSIPKEISASYPVIADPDESAWQDFS